MPFMETFPWLAKMNPMAANGFTAGDDVSVFEYPMIDSKGRDYTLNVSPLICYEDLLPELSRRSVERGADVLVSLSNDAWFGDTVASRQHHMIASFRAVETGRPLIRSTNTGFTAIVSKYGETTASLPPYSDGLLESEILDPTHNVQTIYTKYGDLPWQILSVLIAVIVLLRIKNVRE